MIETRMNVGRTHAAARTDAAWLDAHWMPSTGNRLFKAAARINVEARVRTSLTRQAGRSSMVLPDSGVAAWACRPEITEAVTRQVARLD